MPGNHDAYVRSGVAASRAHWGDYMSGDARRCRSERLSVPAAARAAGAHRGIDLGAEPAADGDRPRRQRSIGSASEESSTQIARAKVCIASCCIHHPPTSKRSHYLKRLTDGARLRDVLARHGAELVIHGHNHRRQTVWLDGPNGRIPAIGVPSASEAPPGEHDPAGYNLYRIDGERGAWRCEVRHARRRRRDGVVEIERTMLASS